MFIDNELKAYFLGWMYSDGCVFYNEQAQSYSTKIKLQSQDEDILHLFMDLSNFKLFNEYKDGLRYPYIITYNREFAKTLVKNGVFPDKSGRNRNFLFFPDIEKEFYPYFIRGLFDGDGSYGIYNGHFNISLYMVSLELLKELKNILKLNGIESIISYYSTREMYSLRIRNMNDCKKFIDYIFKDNLHLILKRKLSIIQESNEIYERITSKNNNHEMNIRVETPDGVFLGVFKSCAEIQRLSKDENFILNNYSNDGKIPFLRDSNIATSCRTGKPYKGLYYEYTT